MSKIYFNHEELTNIKSRLNEEIQNLDSIFKRIKEKIDNIENVWDGDAQDATSTKLGEMYKYFDILIKNGTTYTAFLDQVIQRYKESDTNN